MPALLVYLLFGQAVAWRLLPGFRAAVKGWLGLVFGCVALMWLPCLPAFFLGFTLTAQYIALALAGAAALALLPWKKAPALRKLGQLSPPETTRSDRVGALMSLLATAFCGYLLYTHVLLPHADGSLWVGQSTYGDLAMHLGFVESLYRQGTFPPEYSILPGQQIDYPFLVDAASAGLRFFGLSLRTSVIVPSLFMLMAVFYGFWLLADKLTEKLGPTAAAWALFVFNGGFGFLYFLGGKYNLTTLLSGFYVTPTNLVDEDLRWVNVVCDMLIPQRTTMAGWCVGLAAIYLLVTVLERSVAGGNCRRQTLALAVTAGAMPMIHTHTFLALGVLSAVWFFAWLGKARRAGTVRALVTNYVLYGAVCMLLALPQLLRWTFDAAGTGRLIWFNPGWVHGDTPWLLFWIINGGVVFCAMLPMMAFLRGDRLRLFSGAAALFILGNLVAFQPNPYDDNKLLYIWYMIADILVCGWLWELQVRVRPRALAQAAAAIFLALGVLSGTLTMLREAVSEYQLFSQDQVAAADFIIADTPADSLFLTSTDHTNPVAVLAGRNILCGAGMYLYYHGVDYGQREAQVAEMYKGGESFEALAAHYGVDYVYISPSELSKYAVDRDYFSARYPLIYDQGGISIFQIS